jgi:hypothetical protein
MPSHHTSGGLVYCTVGLDDDTRRGIRRFADDHFMNRAEAMRALIERGLKAEGGAVAHAPSRSRSEPWAKA